MPSERYVTTFVVAARRSRAQRLPGCDVTKICRQNAMVDRFSNLRTVLSGDAVDPNGSVATFDIYVVGLIHQVGAELTVACDATHDVGGGCSNGCDRFIAV